MPNIRIHEAVSDDLPAILELQYLAYQSEARLLGTDNIPPLRENLPEVEQQFRDGLILKAVDESNSIVGSVRGHTQDGTFFIGKLMVHPGYQGKGLGSRLLAEIEQRVKSPHIRRYELFTSDKSTKNLSLYERMGYARFKEKTMGPDLRLVYLEKQC